MRKERRLNACKLVDERFDVTHRPDVVRKKIACFFSERLSNADEVLDVKPALLGLEPGEVSRRNVHGFRDVGLTATFGFPETSEDATVHDLITCTFLAKKTRFASYIAK